MIKILHVISDLKRGGRERQLSVLITNSNNKFEHHVVTFHAAKVNYLDEYNIKNIHLISGKKIERVKKLRRLLRSENFDLIHTWGNSETVYSFLPGLLSGIPLLNGSVRHGILSRRLSHYFRMMVLQLSKNVLANSKAGLKANKLNKGFVLYNGIEEKFYNSDVYDKSSKRSELLGYDVRVPVLISVANLVPYKDYFSILSALKLIKESDIRFLYMIIGSGPLKEQIQKKIKDYKLENEVLLLGSKNNVHEYLKTADIFIHSSKGEGCSNAILEAMASGLPVIASDTGGTSEIVKPEYGFLFEYKNANQLFEKISFALNNIEKIIDMSLSAREEIKKNFSVPVMTNNYQEIIKKILKGA